MRPRLVVTVIVRARSAERAGRWGAERLLVVLVAGRRPTSAAVRVAFRCADAAAVCVAASARLWCARETPTRRTRPAPQHQADPRRDRSPSRSPPAAAMCRSPVRHRFPSGTSPGGLAPQSDAGRGRPRSAVPSRWLVREPVGLWQRNRLGWLVRERWAGAAHRLAGSSGGAARMAAPSFPPPGRRVWTGVAPVASWAVEGPPAR